MRLPKGDRCGTPFRRLFPGRRWLAEVGGGVDGQKLCTTLLAPLVLVHESSESERTSLTLSAALFFLSPPPPPPPPCFFLGR